MPYFSHKWEDDEVLFKDMKKGGAERKARHAKIQQACRQDADDIFEYIWIDTCCIDKRSSAEFSEAISSMLNWYRRAKICYALPNGRPFR